MGEKKFYYCPKCKDHPDVVKEVFDFAVHTRQWVNDCYELVEETEGDLIKVSCGVCNTDCEERDQD